MNFLTEIKLPRNVFFNIKHFSRAQVALKITAIKAKKRKEDDADADFFNLTNKSQTYLNISLALHYLVLAPLTLLGLAIEDAISIANRLAIIAIHLIEHIANVAIEALTLILQLAAFLAQKTGQAIGYVCNKGLELGAFCFKKAIKAPFTALWNKLFKAKAAGSEAPSVGSQTPPATTASVTTSTSTTTTSTASANTNPAEDNAPANAPANALSM